jgi:hypothetical protein
MAAPPGRDADFIHVSTYRIMHMRPENINRTSESQDRRSFSPTLVAFIPIATPGGETEKVRN